MSAPINHMRQIPLFPTPRFINSNNLYLTNEVLFPPFGTLKCVLVRCNLTIESCARNICDLSQRSVKYKNGELHVLEA